MCIRDRPILSESARQQGITLTGWMEPCNSCLPARGQRAPVAKRSGGRVARDLASKDVLAIDMCGPFTPSLGGNLYTPTGRSDESTVWGMECVVASALYAHRERSDDSSV